VLRLRCYLPSTSMIIVGGIVACLLLRSANRASRAIAGPATEIVIAVGIAAVAAATITMSATVIRRRRAAAGACHTCSHPCRGATEPLPERDAQLWPHRPLSYLPGAPKGGATRAHFHDRVRKTGYSRFFLHDRKFLHVNPRSAKLPADDKPEITRYAPTPLESQELPYQDATRRLLDVDGHPQTALSRR
jgi:hypothetical protein